MRCYSSATAGGAAGTHLSRCRVIRSSMVLGFVRFSPPAPPSLPPPLPAVVEGRCCGAACCACCACLQSAPALLIGWLWRAPGCSVLGVCVLLVACLHLPCLPRGASNLFLAGPSTNTSTLEARRPGHWRELRSKPSDTCPSLLSYPCSSRTACASSARCEGRDGFVPASLLHYPLLLMARWPGQLRSPKRRWRNAFRVRRTTDNLHP